MVEIAGPNSAMFKVCGAQENTCSIALPRTDSNIRR